jgi:hypothetical protein
MEEAPTYNANARPQRGKLIKNGQHWFIICKVIDSADNRVEAYMLELPLTYSSLKKFSSQRHIDSVLSDYDYIGHPVEFHSVFIDSRRYAEISKFLEVTVR